MWELVGRVLLLLLLTKAAYQDMKEKMIDIGVPLLMIGMGVLCRTMSGEWNLWEMLMGSMVGLLLLLISWLCHGSVGAGDGMMFVGTGVFLGWQGNVTLFVLALGFAAIMALFLLVVEKKRKDYRMPFVPCVLAAYLCLLI